MGSREIWARPYFTDNSDDCLVAYIDGSYDAVHKQYSYGDVLVKPDGTEKSIYGLGNNKLYLDSCHIIGKILGIINALDWAVANGFEKVKIYQDSRGLPKLISGKLKAETKATKMFVSVFEERFEGAISVEFVRVTPRHSEVPYKEKARQLAKLALNEFSNFSHDFYGFVQMEK